MEKDSIVSPQRGVRSQQHPTAFLQYPSNGTILLNNLRCLDLDRLPDWPGVTPHTFSARNKDTSFSTQKERIHAAEWVLFRLFQIWDADEASKVRSPCITLMKHTEQRSL